MQSAFITRMITDLLPRPDEDIRKFKVALLCPSTMSGESPAHNSPSEEWLSSIALALVLGTNPRIGEHSLVHKLDQEIIRLIVEFVREVHHRPVISPWDIDLNKFWLILCIVSSCQSNDHSLLLFICRMQGLNNGSTCRILTNTL